MDSVPSRPTCVTLVRLTKQNKAKRKRRERRKGIWEEGGMLRGWEGVRRVGGASVMVICHTPVKLSKNTLK